MEYEKLSRADAITKFIERYGIDINKAATRIIVKVVDHTGNSFAPEQYCYKISFTLHGQRKKFGFWPNTAGYQGC